MGISDSLLRAILAMDTYNREQGEGISVTGTQIGNATKIADSTAVFTPEELELGN